ncbi:hypothetical protein [Mesorhizobium sp. KR2-14]|uniref:hypothetical protein n=1 Tax=Mesorhizobium sp. KR2-14 TaxID=3156610 RepID=UPI0032B5EE23
MWRGNQSSISAESQLQIPHGAERSHINKSSRWITAKPHLKSLFTLLLTGRLRLIPQVETYPRVVAFAQTYAGRVALLCIFGLLLFPTKYPWQFMVVGTAACAYAGQYRRWALTAITLLFLGFQSYKLGNFTVLASVLAFSAGLTFLTCRFRQFLVFRWPVLSLHVLVMALVMVAATGVLNGTAQGLLWPFLFALCGSFFFLAYALRDQGNKDRWPVLAQLGTIHPFWGGTSTPFGKGAAYLRKVEAAYADDLAITQIKAVKLLAWVYVLKAISVAFGYVSHDAMHIPFYQDAFERHAAGMPYPWYLSSLALITYFFEALMGLAIAGHMIVACARMAGFRLLRNTYRPLASRTIAEFWNRYYFYFKELLVEFYYYPTFFQCFKRHKRIRLLFATFMAAGVGNAFYHFIRDIEYVQSMGLLNAVAGYQTYLFYCVVLSAGIGLSQLRPRKDPATMNAFRRHVLAPLGVATFFCILLIFSDEDRQYSLAQHFSFLFHLFGG